MKKMIAIALVLMLCVSALSISAFAAFDTVKSLAVVGSGIPGVKDWTPGDPAGDMTEVSDGIWEKTLVCPAGTSMQLKIAGNDKWDDTCNFGGAQAGMTITLGQKADMTCGGGSKDMTLNVTAETTIKITVDLTSEPATILVVDVNAGGNDDGNDDGNDTPVNPQPPVVEPTIDAYYVAGSAGLCGVEWDPAAAENAMTKGEDGKWSITYTNVPAGDYELKVTAGNWDNCWGLKGENVKFTLTEEAAEITVKFNPATGWVSVYNGENPLTNDVSLAGIGIALLAATAGVVALVGKKKEF